MIEFIGIIGAIALVAIGFGAIMAAAFGIKEDEEDRQEGGVYLDMIESTDHYDTGGTVTYAIPPSAVDEEIARWQEASERTFQRQGIRRNR